jgi:copper chaperone CopZ
MDKTELDREELEDILNPAHRSVIRTDHLAIEGSNTDESVQLIQEALSKVKGVQEVVVDREKSIVNITYDSRKTNVPALHDALLGSGYTATRTAS